MAYQDEELALALEPDRRRLFPIVEQADAADRRGGEDGEARAVVALRFVVERDVARDDREVERATGLGDAFDATDELAHDLGPLWVAEVEAVGDRERLRADRAQIAVG